MKKLLPLVLAICLLIACQPTPDEPVVVQKDTERLVDTVLAQQPSDGPKENVPITAAPIEPITERFTFDYTSENGFLHITADADISVPKTGKIPMTYVKAHYFSDEFAKKVFDYVYQGNPVYVNTHGPKTKAVIANELTYYQQIANEGTWEENGFVDAQEVDEIIEQLKELYPNAPETPASEPVLSDGSMTVESYYGSDTYKLEIDDEIGYIEVYRSESSGKDHTPQNSGMAYFRGAFDTRIGYEESSSEGLRAFQHWYSEYDSYRIDTADDTKEYGQTYSPKEAAELGLQFFRDLGVTDIAPRDMCYLYVAHPNGAAKSLYLIEYVRIVEGIPVAFIPTVQAYPYKDSTELPWAYEQIHAFVDDEGIESVGWHNPIDVTGIVSDQVNVISFEEASTIFKSMCGVVYEPQTVTSFDADCYLDVKVEHVELNLIRIREQNAEMLKTGLYVPAWIFYGKEVAQYNERGEPDFDKPFSKILLAVNAVDGSIIDLHKGY